MRVIVVHQDPSPTGGPEAICTLKLIRALADEGVDVSVVMRRAPHESLPGPRVDCHPGGREDAEGGWERLQRVVNLYPEEGWGWAAVAARKIETLCAKGEVRAIYSRAMPFISHVAAWRAKKTVKVPWIAHFSDPWPPDGYSEGRKYSNLRLRWHGRVVSAAEAVTFPCERVARFCEEKQWRLRSSQRKPRRIILPHIAGQFGGMTTHSRRAGEEIVFLHCGGLTEKRRPDELVTAWAEFIGRHPEKRRMLKFRHVGGVSERLRALARDKGVADTVEQTGPCSYEESLRYMAGATALLLVDSYKIRTSVYFPSKLSDYIGAGKPVVAITPEDGTVTDLLGNGYPLRADPWDEEGITTALERTLDAIEEVGDREWLAPIEALRHACAPAIVARRLIESIESLQDGMRRKP